MIITRTSLRISFLGGGTDYPAYFQRFGGTTLATSINKYTYVTVCKLTRFFKHQIGAYYSRVELVNALDALEHPSLRECLRYMGIDHGVEIHVAADLPARTGLGSSSCFTVSLLHALHASGGKMVSTTQLADMAIHVEQQMIHERVGCQDQYACALGGLNQYQFLTDGTIRATPITLTAKRSTHLQDSLMLFYTGLQRTAHDIIKEQLDRTSARQIDAQLARLASLVDEGVTIVGGDGDMDDFGRLLHEGWMLKRSFSSQTSTQAIDDWYQKAVKNGALGGKLLGAGGGGFLLLYVPVEQQPAVRQALTDLQEVDFAFEHEGSTVIFYEPWDKDKA